MKTILATAIFVLCAAQFGCFGQAVKADDTRHELYLTRIAAAEALLQLNKISTAREYLDACNPEFRDLEWNFLDAALDQSKQSFALSPGVSFSGVKLSPDGKTLALCSSDSLISLYSYPELRPLKQLRGHHQAVSTLDFNHDGSRLASGGRDHAVMVWEVASGKLLFKNDSSFSQGIYQVRFSPDDRQLGVVSWERLPDREPHIFGFAKLLDGDDGSELKRIELDNHPAAGIAFSPDGKSLLVSTWGEIASSFDLGSGSLNWSFDLSGPEEYNAFHAMDISPDGQLLALGCTDHRVYLLDVASGKVLHRLEPWQGHSKNVKAVCFSPDGKSLATAGDDQSVLIWSTEDVSRTHTLIGHVNTVTGLAWSRDGKTVISVSSDKTAKTWDLNSPFLTSYTICDYGPWQTPLSSDHHSFAAPCSDKKLAIYRIADGSMVSELGAQSALCADLSSDGKILVTASFDGVVRLWDPLLGKELQTFSGHKSRVDGVAYMNTSRQALSVGDSSLRVWKLGSKREERIVNLGAAPFRIVLQPDEKRAFVGFHDGRVAAYDTQSWKETGRFQCEKSPQEMAMSPDGKLLALFCGAEIEVWDTQTLARRHLLKGHEKSGYGVGFSGDSRYLVSGSYDQTFRLWNLGTGRCTLAYHGFDETVYTSKFLSATEILLSTSQGKMMYYRF